MSLLNEDESLLNDSQKMVEGFESYLRSMQAKLARLYSPSGYGFFDVLKDPTFVFMYIIKAIRVALLWVALTFAKGIFMPMYSSAVYVQNTKPPSALWFVLIYVAIDMSLNLAMFIILLTLKFIFKTDENTFPVSDHLIHAIVVDYAITTTMMTFLSLIVASVIQRKKYFRYRFEGDRGIRAMSDMLFWITTGVLFIPFFRFIDA